MNVAGRRGCRHGWLLGGLARNVGARRSAEEESRREHDSGSNHSTIIQTATTHRSATHEQRNCVADLNRPPVAALTGCQRRSVAMLTRGVGEADNGSSAPFRIAPTELDVADDSPISHPYGATAATPRPTGSGSEIHQVPGLTSSGSSGDSWTSAEESSESASCSSPSRPRCSPTAWSSGSSSSLTSSSGSLVLPSSSSGS